MEIAAIVAMNLRIVARVVAKVVARVAAIHQHDVVRPVHSSVLKVARLRQQMLRQPLRQLLHQPPSNSYLSVSMTTNFH